VTIAAAHDLEIYQADVEGAYLNGELHCELFMRVPQGYTASTGNVLCLKKTLYGLKQSGREWWKVLGDALNGQGFERCENEWTVHPTRTSMAYKRFCLPMSTISVRAAIKIDRVLDGLASKWKISKLGAASHILGTKVTRDRSQRKLWISQNTYIDSLVKRFPGFSTARNAPLPKKLEDEDFNHMPATLSTYQELAGCILWVASCTHRDISYAASYLSSFTSAPSEGHWDLAL